MPTSYLHVNLVICSKYKVASQECGDECDDGMVGPGDLAEQHGGNLINGRQNCQVACVLKRGLYDKLEFISQPA